MTFRTLFRNAPLILASLVGGAFLFVDVPAVVLALLLTLAGLFAIVFRKTEARRWYSWHRKLGYSASVEFSELTYLVVGIGLVAIGIAFLFVPPY